ncbi:MAG: Fe-S cluster assembly protein SufD [Acidobacteriota bacterium]|jgi:Fe-S cluster assembly protein SufD|nr:Fe-S cluster assembly protein SufD [Acidobacteriota bacterium]
MMSQAVKEENAYSAFFHKLQEERASASDPSWVQRLRQNAFKHFEELGFPATHQEEWKYTNVAPIAKGKFEPASESLEGAPTLDAARLQEFSYEEAQRSQLVFVNGFYRPELSSVEALPEGVVATDIAGALKEEKYVDVLREQLARSTDYTENAFTALNTAMFSSGAFLLIPKGVQVESPIHLLFISDASQAQNLSSLRLLVVSERGSSATVIESYVSARETDVYFTNAVVEIALADGARLNHYKVQRESIEAFHVATTRASLARNSSFNSTTITLGARLSRHNINVSLDGEGAECWVDGLYLVTTGQHTDTHSLIDHRQPHCTSHQLYKGILDGKSRAVFNGKVFVRPGAQQTDAMQTNKNLLLSDEARVDTKPQLEIFADDVKCAHGATVGQLEEEELFYLASRGMHRDLARNLLTYGFAEEVIDKIKVESIKAQLDKAVLNRLQARLEV